eukprot:CAMPEP_0170199894 /NCGR_PEP_ID=MMETSP0040_2-20121228/69588_1 /TAXON_ID=641309 /ORGANISM="Lotharella oceanica, Strain CCMP622" /LENGTH=362 /DNA_ID=CAMNT_0010450055 /DNA_START=446 /DNA_END=1534 /DNA_ORIENTATION=-
MARKDAICRLAVDLLVVLRSVLPGELHHSVGAARVLFEVRGGVIHLLLHDDPTAAFLVVLLHLLHRDLLAAVHLHAAILLRDLLSSGVYILVVFDHLQLRPLTPDHEKAPGNGSGGRYDAQHERRVFVGLEGSGKLRHHRKEGSSNGHPSGTCLGGAMYKSSKEIYKDLVRLINHIGARTEKGKRLLDTVRHEFRKNKHLTDPEAIEEAKAAGARALSNFLLSDSLSKMQKRDDAGDVSTGMNVEYDNTRFNQDLLEEKVAAAFEAGPAEAKETGPSTDAMAWAEEDEDFEDDDGVMSKDDMAQLEQASETLASTIEQFESQFEPRQPGEEMIQFFQRPETYEKPSEQGQPTVVDVEAQEKA